MKIVINENPRITETEIVINCKETNEETLRLVSLLKANDNKLTGFLNNQVYVLSPKNVLYIDTADKKSFIYCTDTVYETNLRLYELEERLSGDGFVRISKSAIVNLWQVKSLRPDFGARLMLTMNNNECITVSRQYSQAIKEKLGIK